MFSVLSLIINGFNASKVRRAGKGIFSLILLKCKLYMNYCSRLIQYYGVLKPVGKTCGNR
jgi:hypothetical protein